MAVTDTSPVSPITTFYLQHQRVSYLIVIAFQCACGVMLGTILLATALLSYTEPLFWIITLVSTFVSSLLSCIALAIVLEPTRVITEAFNHITAENDLTPPLKSSAEPFRHAATKSLINDIYQYTDAQIAKETPAGSLGQTRENKLEAALARSQSSVVVLSPEGTISYASANAPVRHKRDGSTSLDVRFDSGDISLEKWIADCQNSKTDTDKLWTRVQTNSDSTGELRIYDIAASYTHLNGDEVVLVLQDKTDEYEPDEKDLDFIAFAAHELRGPITVIRGYLEVIDDEFGEQLGKENRVLMERLIVSANRLSTYVNNILNVSRYDKQHYRVELTRRSVNEIYDLIAHDMQMRAEAIGRKIVTNLPSDLPAVAADPNSIAEVFSNLIDNAIKYSNVGGTIDISAAQSGDFIEVSVQDHGIGMPDSVIQNLFHKFYRSHRSREQVAGSGIGLYLSKAIIESHGGSIKVTSSENKGSTFTFSLPIFSTIEQKLKKSDNGNNENLIKSKTNWISNHNMYRG